MTLQPTILISRPKEDGDALAQQLAQSDPDVRTIIAPVLEIVETSDEATHQAFDIVILTSRHAAPAAKRLYSQTPVICVGSATAQRALELGLKAISVDGTASDIIDHVLKQKVKSAIHMCGAHHRGDIAERLSAAGLTAKRQVVYSQNPLAFSSEVQADIEQINHLTVPLFSPRSAQIISKNLSHFQGRIDLVAISEICANAWSGPEPKQITISETPNAASMFRAIVAVMHRTA